MVFPDDELNQGQLVIDDDVFSVVPFKAKDAVITLHVTSNILNF